MKLKAMTAAAVVAAVVTAMMAVALALAAEAQDKYTIAYKTPKPGETFVMHNVNSTVGTIEGMPMGTQNISQKAQQWLRMQCLEVSPDGVAKLQATFERTAMEMDMGAMHMAFDSADPRAEQTAAPQGGNAAASAIPTLAVLKVYVGKSITAWVDADGRCQKVEGLNELFDAMAKEMPGGEQFARIFKESMSEDMVKNQWFGGAVWLPHKLVAVGDVWDTDQRMNMGPMGHMIMKSKNKLMGVQMVDGRRIARIGVTTNLELEGNPEGITVPGQGTMKMNFTSQGGSGVWLWDMDGAQMIKLQYISPMEMNMVMTNPAAPGQSMTMVQKINSSTVVEVVGDELAAKLLPTAEPAAPASPAKTPGAVPTPPPAGE